MPNPDEEVLVTVGAEASSLDSQLSAAAGKLDEAVDRMIESLDRISGASKDAADEQEASGQRIGDSFEKSGESADGFSKQLEDAMGRSSKALTGFGEVIASVVSKFNLLFAVISGGALIKAISDIGEKSGEYADQIIRASEKTGIAVDTLQELRFAAQANEVGFGALQISLQRLSTQIAAANNGNQLAIDRFKAVGVAATDLKNAKLEDVLGAIADKSKASADGFGKLAEMQQLLGRSGKELIPLLNQGSDGIKRLSEEAQKLGIVMGEGDLEQAKKLHDQLFELHSVNEALERHISSALVPAFLAISKAMIQSGTQGGLMQRVVDALAISMKYLTIAVQFSTEGFVKWGITIGAAMAMVNNLKSFGSATTTKSIFSEWLSDMRKLTEEGEKFRAGVLAPAQASPSAPKTDTVTPPGGSPKAKDDRLAEWKYALDQMKEAEGYFHEFSKQQEAEYWTAKLALIDRGTKEGERLYRQVDELRYSAAKSAAVEEEAAYQKQVQVQLAAVRTNYAAQLAIIQQNLDHIAQLYGQNSSQYIAELAKQQEAKRKQAEEISKLDQMMIESEKKRTDAGINAAQSNSALELSLGKITNEQKLALDVTYEDKRYQNDLAAAGRRLQIERDSGNMTLEQERQMIGQIEDLTIAHEAKLLQIKQQALQEAAKYQLEATNVVQTQFSTFLSTMMQGTTSLHAAFQTLVKGLTKGIDDIVAKKLTDTLMGNGTQAQSMISDFFGSIFGGTTKKGTTGASGAAAADASLTTLSTAATTNTSAMTALTAAANLAAVALQAVASAGAGGGAGGGLGGLGDLGGDSGGFSGGLSDLADVAPSTTSLLDSFAAIPMLADGTDFVPRDMLAVIHAGEKITPAKYNVNSAGSGMTQKNYFAINGPVDSRAQDQIALSAGRYMSRASYKKG